MKKSILLVMLFCITGLSTFISQATYSPQETKEKGYQIRKSHRLGTIIRARKEISKTKTLQRSKDRKNKSIVRNNYFDDTFY